MGDDLDIDLGDLLGQVVSLAPNDVWQAFLEVSAEHRDAAIEQGFSPEAAEQMGVALHSGLVALYFTTVADQ